MALVELDAVRLADAVHEPHLQRDDRHRGPGLRQELEGAVEDGGVEDGLVELGVGDAALQQRRRCGLRGGGRHGGGGSGGAHRSGGAGTRRPAVDRLPSRGGDGVGVGGTGFGLAALETQMAAQGLQEGALGVALDTIGVADADRHLVGELAVLGLRERGGGIGQRHPLEQHILIDAGERRAGTARERLGGVAHGGALGVGLAAIGEGGLDEDVEDGSLFGGVHLGWGPSVRAAGARAGFWTMAVRGSSRPQPPGGATKPSGRSAPAPNRNFSISPSRNLRAFGSMGTRRYSLMSMV